MTTDNETDTEEQPQEQFFTHLGGYISDEAIAHRVAERLEDILRYDPRLRVAFVWNGFYWERSVEAVFEAYVREALITVRLAAAVDLRRPGVDGETSNKALKKWARYGSRAAITAIRDLCKSDPRLHIGTEEWDTDPFLLGAPNGIIDLRTGELLPPDREAYISKVTSVDYDPEASFPEWDEVVLDILSGDEEVAGYIQDFFGYAATGSQREAIIMLFNGVGRNGKDTIAEAVLSALGDYSKPAPDGLLVQQRFPRHRAEIAEMRGRRLYLHSELPEGAAMNASRVKQFTGQDALTADLKGGAEIEFVNVTKHLMTVNMLPKFSLNDVATAARVRVVPFTNRYFVADEWVQGVSKADPSLKPRLMNDEDAQKRVLAWIVQGAVRYLKDGLAMPSAVRSATEAYRLGDSLPGDATGLMSWLNDNATRGAEVACDISALYEDYTLYVEARSFSAPYQSVQKFGGGLNSFGLSDRSERKITVGTKRKKITQVNGITLRGVSVPSARQILDIINERQHTTEGGQ